MNPPQPQASDDAYSRYRNFTRQQLWDEAVPRFNRLDGPGRLAEVGLVRALGVVFSTHGSDEEKTRVRTWLRSLLDDPAEKIRRYAINALPKLASGKDEESALLALLQRSTSEREKEYLTRALDKIGGRATLETLGTAMGTSPASLQKVRANIAREDETGRIHLDRTLADTRGLRIHLRGRKGLEVFVREEAEHHPRTRDRFRVIETSKGLVALRPTTGFSLGDLYALRCCGSISFVTGLVRKDTTDRTDALAHAVVSPLTRRLLRTFQEGTPRYRLEFISHDARKEPVADITTRAFALCPDILNDSHRAPWAVDIHPTKAGESVELRPRLTPDPRFAYRLHDVAAASHPPLAACLARWAGRSKKTERIWDPFCGSGLELIESGLLGNATELHGTDLSEEALIHARTNLAAAGLPNLRAQFTCCDFRDYAQKAGLAPGSMTLVISNPPLGRRIRVPNLRGLITDLFRAADRVLGPGGRLVFTNPIHIDCPVPGLKLESRIIADLGGFDCRLEKYVKSSR